MSDKKPTLIFCHACNRGGNGRDKEKCACGWQIKSKRNKAGCFIGTPIDFEKIKGGES